MTEPSEALLDRARSLGAETSFVDYTGERRRASVEALTKVVDELAGDRTDVSEHLPPVVVLRPDQGSTTLDCELERGRAVIETDDDATVELDVSGGGIVLPPLPLGVHRLRLEGAGDAATTLLVAPPKMPPIGQLDRGMALFCPGYALWSEVDPAPSVAHLGTIARGLADCDVELLAVLPLYAAFLGEPHEPSPYAPVSRLHWNEAYLDPETLPGMAPGEKPGLGHDGSGLVDWRAAWQARRSQLMAAVDRMSPAEQSGLDGFIGQHPDVSDYARFRAHTDAAGVPPAPGHIGTVDPTVVRAYELGQWLLDSSLARLAADDDAAGLVVDLPVGCHSHGYETWAHPELFASSMHVGAPPDLLFRGGQDWGFPPMLPAASRREGHDLWRRIVERAAVHSALLRVDHVMGVHRLWWVPEGHGADDGVYVRYPARELLAAASIAAARTGTPLVGENLGTVPPEVTELMAETGLLGMHEEQFTMIVGSDPESIDEAVLAGIRTHDMPAFAAAVAEPAAERYARTIGGTTAAVDELLNLVLDRLARSDANVVVVDLDDLLGEHRPHNVPGTWDPRGWSRQLDVPVDRVLALPGVADRLKRLAAIRHDA